MSVQVTFDCADPLAEARFWASALRYPEPEPTEGWASIADSDGRGPRFYFQRVSEGKVSKNRMHLDLNVGGGSGTSMAERKARVWAEVERLKALGATDARGSVEEAGEFWVRMNDPEGNEFCLQ